MKRPTKSISIFLMLLLNLSGCQKPQPPVEETTAWAVEVPNEGTLHVNVTPAEVDSLRSAAKTAPADQPVTITANNGSLKGMLEEPGPRAPLHVEGVIKTQAPGTPDSVKVRISPEALALIRARKTP
jgi:hypothetical protein